MYFHEHDWTMRGVFPYFSLLCNFSPLCSTAITDRYEPFFPQVIVLKYPKAIFQPPAGHLCIVWMDVVHAMSTPVTKQLCITTCCALLFWLLSRRRRQTHLYVVDVEGGLPVGLPPHLTI